MGGVCWEVRQLKGGLVAAGGSAPGNRSENREERRDCEWDWDRLFPFRASSGILPLLTWLSWCLSEEPGESPGAFLLQLVVLSGAIRSRKDLRGLRPGMPVSANREGRGCGDDGRPTCRGLPAGLGLSYLTVTLG